MSRSAIQMETVHSLGATVVMDELTKEIEGEILWWIIFDDDIVLKENLEEINKTLEEWRVAFEVK